MKIIRVDMSKNQVITEDVPDAYTKMGGRGLIAALLNDEVPATCDPLGVENKLIIAAGLLTGTAMINTSRISIGAKSPLTGGAKESNAGGTIGAAIGHLGIAAIIIEGKVPEAGPLYLLKIDAAREVELIPATEYRGMRTYALVEKLTREHGDQCAVLCIGPAGERQLASSSIQSSDVDGRPCRAAGRGGLGAVMGAKGLKAILVSRDGKQGNPADDKDAFKKATRDFAKAVQADPNTAMMRDIGTAGLVAPLNSLGGFPSYNATQGVLEGWEKISGEALVDMMKKRGGQPTHKGCSQCIIHCSNVYHDEQGQYATGSLEYETIWAFGGMLGITDLDTIAKLDHLCDDIGLDTMNTGVAVAVAMDSGYRAFGDGQGAIDLVEEVAQGTQMGTLIGNGPAAVGRYFNNPRVACVKNQSIAAYDPRVLQANGVTYATSAMGADHTAGNLVGEYAQGNLEPCKPDGAVEASKGIQPVFAFVDCAGLCLFASFALGGPEGGEAFFRAMSAKLGKPFGPEDMIAMGMQTIQAELEFNRKAGLTKADDRLPAFFRQEALPPHNAVFQVNDEELDGIFER